MQGKYGAVTAKLYWKKAERIRMAAENLRFERPEYTHQIRQIFRTHPYLIMHRAYCKEKTIRLTTTLR